MEAECRDQHGKVAVVLGCDEVPEWGRTIVDPVLHTAVNRLPESMRRIVGYHLGWQDRHGRAVNATAGAPTAELAALARLAVHRDH